jgi:hypothetical protein
MVLGRMTEGLTRIDGGNRLFRPASMEELVVNARGFFRAEVW